MARASHAHAWQIQLPRVHPPEDPGGPGEALSVQQKQDLLAFLNRL
jgi:hypothetical protein